MPTSQPTHLPQRIAAACSWAVTQDRRERTAPARDAFNKKFEDEVDPDRVLPEAERAIRAEHARRAHFLRLALKSANARRERRDRRNKVTTGATP